MLGKLTNPSIIFTAGVFIVLIIIAYFVHLHVTIVNKIDNLNEQISDVNTTLFLLMADEDKDENFILLKEQISGLKDSDFLKNVLALHDLELHGDHFDSGSTMELLIIYNEIDNIKRVIQEHNRQREYTFRILYLLFFITTISMILILGINQFENFKILRSEQLRTETNNKLYDQLEKDRSLIAFELHDDIAQKLAIIKRYFNNKNSIDEHTVLMENYAKEVIKRVRYLSRMLKAPDNPEVSFKDYLETLFSDFTVLSDFKLNRRTVGLNALKLNPSASLHIYRIIQEILTNSRIHSEATEIDILIVYSHPTLNIKYRDNGKGFDPYLVYRKGIGLDSIKYRLEILNGKYRLKSSEGEGTDISIDIPVELCEIS